MAESQKEAALTSDSKKKSSSLDEEFGKEFLSSWKSMSVTEDDGMDFTYETAPKGRKKNFNFDKLDMDFALDGDFDKISSFKVDFPDLDFSSAPKTVVKPKERSEKESSNGKHEEKQDRFTFTFDFKELDKFDLDSSLLEGEKKSDKCTDDERFGSSVRHEKSQDSRSNLATTDAFEESDVNKLPTSKGVTTPNSDSLIGGLGDLTSITDTAPSTHAKPENLNMTQSITKSPEKQMTTHAQEIDQPSQHLERKGSPEPYAQYTIQDSCVQPVSGDDSMQENVTELQAEVFSSGTEVNTNPGLQSTNSEFGKTLENQNHIPVGNITEDESAPGNADIVDASITSLSQKMLHNTNATKENKNSCSQLLPASVHSESRIDKLMQIREQGSGGMQLKFLNRSKETESQLRLVSTPMKILSLGDKRMGTVCLSPADERRQDFNANDAQAGSQKVGTLKSNDKALTKGVPVIKGSEKNYKDQNASGFQVQPTSLPEKATKSSSLKCINPRLVVSRMPPIMNSKNISVEKSRLSPPNFAKKRSDISSLKVSRTVTSKDDRLVSMLQKETKTLRNSEGSMEMHVNVATKMSHSIGTEKQKLLSPSLKRKTFEESNADPVTLSPLKRITESHSESRKAREASQRTDEKSVFKTDSLIDNSAKDVFFDHPTCKLDIPQGAYVTELEVPIVIENDGIVEKAEACAKELEDIGNMLKKKHEEAKETLVRALVNNNNLLMLNHPIYEEKIRRIQRFATRLTSKVLQT